MEKVNLEIALAVRGIHTTKAFSDAVGISRQTLGPIRAGIKPASQEVAEQIASALLFTDDEFYDVFPVQWIVYKARNGHQDAINNRLFGGSKMMEALDKETQRKHWQ